MAVNPFLTLVILVTGVVGGLVVVIFVIVFCKYRLKRKVTLRRRQVVERERPHDLPQLKPLLRRESVESIAIREEIEAAFPEFSSIPPKTMNDNPVLSGGAGKMLKNGRHSEMAPGSNVPVPGSSLDRDEQSPHAICEARPSTSSSDYGEGFIPGFRIPGDGRGYGQYDDIPTQRISSAESKVPQKHGNDEKSAVSDVDVGSAAISFADQVPVASTSSSLQFSQKQVSVEVHDEPMEPKTTSVKDDCQSAHRPIARVSSTPSSSQKKQPFPKHKRACHSKSADVVQISRAARLRQTRKYFSYDDAGTYDNLRITEFNSGPYSHADFEIVDESAVESVKACVRYNDQGSIERLDEHFEFYEPDTSDSREDAVAIPNPGERYRDIWHLRATFEEEEECSDTIRLQDTTSPEPSPEECLAKSSMCHARLSREASQEKPCSSEGNCNSPPTEQETCPEGSSKPDNNDSNHLIPNNEFRPQKLRSIYGHKLQSRGNSADTSFDSFETVETDGDVSDGTSRHGCTTSFDSTDNTDSTTDSKLKKMRGDSGYKSMENPQGPGVTEKKLSFSLDVESYEYEPVPETSPKHVIRKDRRHSHIERSGKTASKRRREYRREPRVLQLYESIREPEEFIPRDGSEDREKDDPPDTGTPNKFSVFSRFFRSHGVFKSPRTRSLHRDYSMDETTSKLFNDFIRIDIEPKTSSGSADGKAPHIGIVSARRSDRLGPEKRSASEGTASSKRVLPQKSIEEVDCELEEDVSLSTTSRTVPPLTSHTTIHEIPIIKLPEEEFI